VVDGLSIYCFTPAQSAHGGLIQITPHKWAFRNADRSHVRITPNRRRATPERPTKSASLPFSPSQHSTARRKAPADFSQFGKSKDIFALNFFALNGSGNGPRAAE